MIDLTEEDILNADPEQLSEWISDRLCGKLHMHGDHYQWRYKHKTKWSDRVTAHPEPKPYATEWWAAGPLLQNTPYLAESFNELELRPADIARKWLLAYHEGLVEPDDSPNDG